MFYLTHIVQRHRQHPLNQDKQGIVGITVDLICVSQSSTNERAHIYQWWQNVMFSHKYIYKQVHRTYQCSVNHFIIILTVLYRRCILGKTWGLSGWRRRALHLGAKKELGRRCHVPEVEARRPLEAPTTTKRRLWHTPTTVTRRPLDTSTNVDTAPTRCPCDTLETPS